MSNYTIDYQAKAVAIVNLDNKQNEVKIRYPTLDDAFIEIPLKYSVSTFEDILVGEINSYIPERNHMIMKNGHQISKLIVDSNKQLILQTENNKFNIGKTTLDDIEENKKTSYKNNGFTRGYKLRSSTETGTLDFFVKDGNTRAVLSLDNSDYKAFVPLIMYDKMIEDIGDKKVKKPEIAKKEFNIIKSTEDGPFVKWVKEKYTPRIIIDAFEYQEQNDEKKRFFEYMDSGSRPVALNGPTGNGKTVLSRNYACERGLPFYFDVGNNSFKLSNAVGKFVPTPGTPTFAPGSMTLAAIFGGVYTLEEMPPVPQDELTGMNIFLETGELAIITHFGHEILRAHKDFRLTATGNFHSNYTSNELNDAFLQRFSQIKMGYPSKDPTIDILKSRAPGLDYDTAENLAVTLIKMREEAIKFQKDLGLKGIVEVAQRIEQGSKIPIAQLLEDNVINPLTTYESIEAKNGKLHTKLVDIAKELF